MGICIYAAGVKCAHKNTTEQARRRKKRKQEKYLVVK
jgi:hypothetical protein